MGQKYLVALFAIIILGGLGVAAYNSFKESASGEITPTPTPGNLIFNYGQSKQGSLGNINQNSQPSPIPSHVQGVSQGPQAAQKMIKAYQEFPGVLAASELAGKKAVIETEKGKIEVEIYPDAPKAASNFIFLAKDGFYDGLTFHRVEPGFVIQGGDPLGNGTGGPGYKFEDEPVTRKYDRGTVAMANAGPNTNGSQFFITLADLPQLPPKYTIFGKVISGMEVVDKVTVGDVMKKVSISSLN